METFIKGCYGCGSHCNDCCSDPCAAAEGTAQAAASDVTPVSISTNEIAGWPAGPEITSETGVLMDADSGTLLYSKGGDEIRYPASITKIMTLLLAVENCS